MEAKVAPNTTLSQETSPMWYRCRQEVNQLESTLCRAQLPTTQSEAPGWANNRESPSAYAEANKPAASSYSIRALFVYPPFDC